MRRFQTPLLLLLALGLLAGSPAQAQGASSSAAAPVVSPALARVSAPAEAHPSQDRLTPYRPRLGRSKPLVAIVAENYYTELTDYVLPYGVLSAAGVAEVQALAMQPGPIRMFPAPMNVEPQATTARFDEEHPEGADYVIVPAVHKDDDPALLAWVKSQAAKGATIVGVCDGVWVLARAGLLDGRRATGHWYSREDLRKKFPQVQWQQQLRYVEDRRVITTTGVSATIPVSLALVEAMAGTERATQLARELGGAGMAWSAQHPSERFQMSWKHKLTIGGNAIAFWSHEDVGIPVDQGVDEIALALKAEVYSATYRSTALAVAPRPGLVKSRRGLSIVPDRVMGADAPRRMLSAPDANEPLQALDQALKGIASDYGPRTAAWVALQMEYPGY